MQSVLTSVWGTGDLSQGAIFQLVLPCLKKKNPNNTVTVQTSELVRDCQSSCTMQCDYKVKLSPKRVGGRRLEKLVLIGFCQTAL